MVTFYFTLQKQNDLLAMDAHGQVASSFKSMMIGTG
jgi:hypothetical protein